MDLILEEKQKFPESWIVWIDAIRYFGTVLANYIKQTTQNILLHSVVFCVHSLSFDQS